MLSLASLSVLLASLDTDALLLLFERASVEADALEDDVEAVALEADGCSAHDGKDAMDAVIGAATSAFMSTVASGTVALPLAFSGPAGVGAGPCEDDGLAGAAAGEPSILGEAACFGAARTRRRGATACGASGAANGSSGCLRALGAGTCAEMMT